MQTHYYFYRLTVAQFHASEPFYLKSQMLQAAILVRLKLYNVKQLQKVYQWEKDRATEQQHYKEKMSLKQTC